MADRKEVGFQAIEMAMSPDQAHLAFVWSTSTFITVRPYDSGIWVLDLNQFTDE